MKSVYDDWKGYHVWHVSYGEELKVVYSFVMTMYRMKLLSGYNFNYVNEECVIAWIH